MCRVKDKLKANIVKHGGCWLWRSAIGKDRYATFCVDGVTYIAHRISWEIYNSKKIPYGKLVLHSCDRKACINPKHLRVGNYQDNTNDAIKRRRLPYGERNKNSKLTTNKVIEIRRKRKAGASVYQLSMEYGVTSPTIYNVIYKCTWKKTTTKRGVQP